MTTTTKAVPISELSGAALDWAVAKCEGATSLWHDTIASWWFTLDGEDRTTGSGWSQTQRFRPSREWVYGGPIIERENISVEVLREGDEWCAAIGCTLHDFLMWDQPYATDVSYGEGPTPLVAAMRCYVASKTDGDSVMIPEELI